MRPITVAMIWCAVLLFLVLVFMAIFMLGITMSDGGKDGGGLGTPGVDHSPGMTEKNYIVLMLFLWLCLAAGIYDLLYAVFARYYSDKGIVTEPDPLGGRWKYAFLILIFATLITSSGNNG
ncbi:MAG: hypothetical protein WC379_04130 [Methanoregula sp.]